MTEGSRWRAELACRIAPLYAEIPDVQAVIIGGSVSRGIADRYSDVEIGVYWSRPPTEAERQAVADRIGVLGHDLEPYRMDPEDPGSYGADEDIYIGGDRRSGFQVDVKHTGIKELESILDKPGVGEREVIYNAIPLYGHERVADWKARLAPDTEEQAKNAVAKSLRFGPWWIWEQFVEEGESMWAINGLNWLLMGLSRQYQHVDLPCRRGRRSARYRDSTCAPSF